MVNEGYRGIRLWSWWGGGRGSGAAQRLPATHCQVFTSLASWKPNIPASCLGAGTGVEGVRGGGGSIMKTLSDHSPSWWHLNTKAFWCRSGAETLQHWHVTGLLTLYTNTFSWKNHTVHKFWFVADLHSLHSCLGKPKFQTLCSSVQSWHNG